MNPIIKIIVCLLGIIILVDSDVEEGVIVGEGATKTVLAMPGEELREAEIVTNDIVGEADDVESIAKVTYIH